MIQANEIRLNNWVNYNEYNCQVIAITSDWVQLDNNALNTPIDEIKVIPLTEEWLLKFGLKIKKHGGIGGQDQWAGMDFIYYDSECLFRGNPKRLHLVGYFNTQIMFVYQLQNLIFALSGKEL